MDAVKQVCWLLDATNRIVRIGYVYRPVGTRVIECPEKIHVVAYVHFEGARGKLRFAPGADPGDMRLAQESFSKFDQRTSEFHALIRASTPEHSETNGFGLACMYATIPANGIPSRVVKPARADETPESESEHPT